MTRDRIGLLRTQLTETHERLRRRLDGLTEDEYWWEPVPGCWTLRRQPDGRLLEDYPDEFPHPTPAPFTTIAWRLFHIASCKVVYHEYAFGAGRLNASRPPHPPARRDRHIHLRALLVRAPVDEPDQLRGAVVTEHGTVARVEQRGPPLRVARDRTAERGVDARVQATPPASVEPGLDRLVGEPYRPRLPPGHHPGLLRAHLPQHSVRVTGAGHRRPPAHRRGCGYRRVVENSRGNWRGSSRGNSSGSGPGGVSTRRPPQESGSWSARRSHACSGAAAAPPGSAGPPIGEECSERG